MPTKPTHTPKAEPVATVRIHAFWGNLSRGITECRTHSFRKELDMLVAGHLKSEPTPTRVSYLVEERSYNRARDIYSKWRPVSRHNHLGQEIAL